MMPSKSPNSAVISLSLAMLNCNPAVAGGMILKCNSIRQLPAAGRQKSSPGCGGRLHGKPCGDRTVLTAVLLSVPGRMNLNGATEGMLASDRAARRDEKPPFLQKSAENKFSVSHSRSRFRITNRGTVCASAIRSPCVQFCTFSSSRIFVGHSICFAAAYTVSSKTNFAAASHCRTSLPQVIAIGHFCELCAPSSVLLLRSRLTVSRRGGCCPGHGQSVWESRADLSSERCRQTAGSHQQAKVQTSGSAVTPAGPLRLSRIGVGRAAKAEPWNAGRRRRRSAGAGGPNGGSPGG